MIFSVYRFESGMGEWRSRRVRLCLGYPGINEVIYMKCACVSDPRYADSGDGQLDNQSPPKGTSGGEAMIENLGRDLVI